MMKSMKKFYSFNSLKLHYVLNPPQETRNTFYAKDLQINLSKTQKSLPELNTSLKFGQVTSDHMLVIQHDSKNGWHSPEIKPFGPLKMHPFNSALHYGIQCFEGMKAFRGESGQCYMFRPELNMNRIYHSSQRLTLPEFSTTEFLKCIHQLLKIDERWIPNKKGYSLYMRPNFIANNRRLGIDVPTESTLYCVFSPVGPYYPSGFKPVRLYCEKDNIRASPGGAGNYKLGANYGHTILWSKQAETNGFGQVLWLFEGWVGEVGTSNIFFIIKNQQGEGRIEIITPPANDLILHGIMRDSTIQLIKEKKIKITERMIHMDEVIQLHKQKMLIEAFTTGTAVTVSSIESFFYDGVEYTLPINQEINSGEITFEIYNQIQQIQYGEIEHPWQYKI